MRSLARRLDALDPQVVSVGFPGPVDSEGVALRAPTVWGPDPEPEPVAERLQQIWPAARVVVSNDLSAAGHCFLRDVSEDICVVTVSSGIGHKVFLDGRPVAGTGGRGGEIGHLRVDFSAEAPICDCGDRGHLGAVASGRAIYNHAVRLAHSDPEAFACSSVGRTVSGDVSRLDNQLVAQAFRAHDPWATELIGRVAEPLGRVLAGIHSAVGVERFVIIGGAAHALGPLYLGLVGQAAAQSQWSLGQCWEQMLELGVMGDDAGLIGAGRLAAR
jgi:glucokinase